MLCLIISPAGIYYTWLPLTWTPDSRPHYPMQIAWCSSSLQRDFAGLLFFSNLFKTHTKIMVELRVLLEAVSSIPCHFCSPPDLTDLHSQHHSVLMLGRTFFLFNFWPPNFTVLLGLRCWPFPCQDDSFLP